MSIKKNLRKMDLIKIIPEKLKESSYLGLGLSGIFIITLILMITNQLMGLLSNDISSELLIDHQKDDKDLLVSLDVLFYNYPCGMISLDKMDVLHSHIMDTQENLKKLRVDQNGKIISKYTNNPELTSMQRIETIEQ